MCKKKLMNVFHITKCLPIQKDCLRFAVGSNQFIIGIKQKLRHCGIGKGILLQHDISGNQLIGKNQKLNQQTTEKADDQKQKMPFIRPHLPGSPCQ